MTVYRHKPSQPLKWLVALIVFALALGVTFSDVYGYSGDDKSADDSGTLNNGDAGYLDDGNTAAVPADESPTPVPEPTTLLLLAGGLGAMYAARRRKQRS